MSTKKMMREVAALLEAAGLVILEITYGRHVKFRVQTPIGPRLLVVSISASDRRVLKYIERDIKRLAAP